MKVALPLAAQMSHHLRVLVETAGGRPPGSPANARATAHVHDVLARAGLPVRTAPFTTRWWEPGDGTLATGGRVLPVTPNPFSPPCAVEARVARVASLDELGAVDTGRIVVAEGPLAAEQVTPIGYPFYSVDSHTRLVAALVRAAPAAVVAVSDHWAPIFEDANLPFPSTTVATRHGAALVDGEPAELRLGGAVRMGAGMTVSAGVLTGRRGVVCAHLDSKVTSPGAFDNGASVATVLAVVEAGPAWAAPVEVVLFNGEDHFDACGEQAWLAEVDLADIAFVVNLDGTGVRRRRTEVSALAAPPAMAAELEAFVARHRGWMVGEPWLESDHAVFALAGIPALAVTCERPRELLQTLAHTPRDDLGVVDVAVMEDVADALPDLVELAARTTGLA